MRNFVHIIPCRKGSKRIINKNFKQFYRSNLTEISLTTLLKSGVDKNDIYISSDSLNGKEIADKYEVNYHNRDSNLASDFASTFSLIKNIILSNTEISNYRYLSLIQPTCPLRNEFDISDACKKIIDDNKNSLISISECGFSHPEYLYEIEEKKIRKYTKTNDNKRSQEMNPTFFRNGAIYISKIDYLKIGNAIIDSESLTYYKMPFLRSINIDTEEDWQLAELIYKNNQK